MLLSLSISVFAAEADEHTIYDSVPDEEPVVSNEAATSGTIQNSGIRWSLDEKGWLTISGSGEAPAFTSADDQPWAAVRDQITEVWFEDVETLTIPDLAYWFEGCVNLTTAELPLTPVIVNQMKPGAVYITSGIIDDKEQIVVDAVKAAGLEILEVTYQGEWVSVTARKQA